MGIFSKIANFIAKASIPVFKFENNHLHFKLRDDEFYEYDLKEYDIKTRHDSYVHEAYTLTSSDVFLEYIRIDSNTTWAGHPLSVFEGFFKEKLLIKSMETIEKKVIGHFTFETIKVDESFVIHMIHIYMANIDVIIVDAKGDLYKNLLFRLDGNYLYKYDNEEKGNINFNISLVKENIIRGFFNAR